MTAGPDVRAVPGAARVPGLPSPLDTIHFRVFHPARWTGSDAERLTGELPPDPTEAPWPVVVVLPGVNIGPEGYTWLAVELARAGYAVVTMALVGETMPGSVGITPGLDLDACRPGRYGTAPTSTTLRPLLDAVADLGRAGRLEGMFDLDRVTLLGHSAGGTIALHNASPEWFGVAAAVSFAGHTVPSAFLGHPPGTVLAMPAAVPALLLAAELDGVMANSSDRYGARDDPDHDPITATFERALPGPAVRATLVGANHTSIVHPADPTMARGFLDPPATRPGAEVRDAVAAAVIAFLDTHVRGATGAEGRLAATLADGSAFTDVQYRVSTSGTAFRNGG